MSNGRTFCSSIKYPLGMIYRDTDGLRWRIVERREDGETER